MSYCLARAKVTEGRTKMIRMEGVVRDLPCRYFAHTYPERLSETATTLRQGG